MDKDLIRLLITRFFENDLPKESILKFQKWFIRRENIEKKEQVLNELWEQETAKADERTIQALGEMNRRIGSERKCIHRSFPRRLLRTVSILLLPIMSGVLTYWIMHNRQNSSTQPVTAIVEHVVPDGEMKHILLPDSSSVWLNAGSILFYSDGLRGTSRCLFLSGEATFQVQKDESRPFIVKTQYMEVEALGTVFNVKSYLDEGMSTVTLEEGSVRVDVDGKVKASEVISPDEQFAYDHRHGKISRMEVDSELVSRWREGYLVFENVSFEDIIRTVERRFNVTVYYDIRKYGGGAFSVKYAPYENIRQILTVLETLNPGLRWTIEDDIIYIK